MLVVGHNPTMASLAAVLDDGEGDEEAGNELALDYPTSAVTVFSYDGEWPDLDEASASVVAFHVGRGLRRPTVRPAEPASRRPPRGRRPRSPRG